MLLAGYACAQDIAFVAVIRCIGIFIRVRLCPRARSLHVIQPVHDGHLLGTPDSRYSILPALLQTVTCYHVQPSAYRSAYRRRLWKNRHSLGLADAIVPAVMLVMIGDAGAQTESPEWSITQAVLLLRLPLVPTVGNQGRDNRLARIFADFVAFYYK